MDSRQINVLGCYLFGEATRWLADHGTSLEITWDEESCVWSVSWISSGVRYNAQSEIDPFDAITDILDDSGCHKEFHAAIDHVSISRVRSVLSDPSSG